MLEFLHTLEHIDYQGWLTLDLVLTRESPVDASTLSIANLKIYQKLLSRLDHKALLQVQREQNAIDAQQLIHRMLANE